MLLALLKTLRPKQWIKNTFVALPLVFGQKLFDLDALLRVAAAFALFCLISGCVYIVNDIVDVEKDRAHPKKKHRPIPSGALPPKVARNFTIVAVPLALGAGFWLAPLYAAALGGYFVLNLLYCFYTKRIPYLDVLSIATGFVLRVLAGALVIPLPPSLWLLGCTALLAMFLGFGKRAHEFAQSGTETRSVLQHYSPGALRWILHTLALLTALVYGLYTQSEHVHQTFGDAPLIFTLPFPIISILRFIHLVTSRPDAESPTEEMLRDWLFMGSFIIWVVSTGVLLYWF
ncbi:decaprenyl-phosphate phosphoribosyltransferase [Pseudenhygromyxa sp. WMMC2535]|uniref:decaprenyl-phosphate phosphoribosyltransferase n=1 Tax=Pseudenhygromyxa sp. WMMC2535 TaxID=2712867 RepID=UPI001555996F|nr:decaprenyl-phosphate phosphoribosyltransferase [Pseudenhygromyxa sp. WMMC2535]